MLLVTVLNPSSSSMRKTEARRVSITTQGVKSWPEKPLQGPLYPGLADTVGAAVCDITVGSLLSLPIIRLLIPRLQRVVRCRRPEH